MADVAALKMIYVVAHDGGCEGHSLPVLAFEDRAAALRWASLQESCFSVVAVPVYPEMPLALWYNIKPER